MQICNQYRFKKPHKFRKFHCWYQLRVQFYASRITCLNIKDHLIYNQIHQEFKKVNFLLKGFKDWILEDQIQFQNIYLLSSILTMNTHISSCYKCLFDQKFHKYYFVIHLHIDNGILRHTMHFLSHQRNMLKDIKI